MEEDLEVIRESAAWYRHDSGVSIMKAEDGLLNLKNRLTPTTADAFPQLPTTVPEIKLQKNEAILEEKLIGLEQM